MVKRPSMWKNTGFVLSQSFRISPSKIILGFVHQAVVQLKEYILAVLLVGLVVHAAETGWDISQALFLLGICLATAALCQCFELWYVHYFSPLCEENFQCRLNRLLDRKALRIGAEAYEDSRFFDRMSLSLTQALPRMESVLQNAYTLAGRLLSSLAIGTTIAVLDPVCLIFVAATVGLYLTVKNRSNKLRYRLSQDNVRETRIKNWASQIFMDRRAALEIRMTGIAEVLKDLYRRSSEACIRNLGKYCGKITFLRTMQNGAVTFCSFFSSLIYLTIKAVFFQFPISSFVLLVNANVQMSGKLMDTIFNFSAFAEDSLYIENLREFLDLETGVDEDARGERPALFQNTVCFRKVSYRYPNSGKMVLEGIDLTIAKGEKIALVGRNGSGKSTLLNLLLRLCDPAEGAVEMDGTDIRRFAPKEYRERFVTVFQDFRLYAFSLRDNLQMGNRARLGDEEIARALDTAGLGEKLSRLPLGLDTQLTKEFDDNGALFSGGEMQKLGIARALLKKGDIVVLDEPTSAMDPVSEKAFFDWAFRQWADKTIVYISHDMAAAQHADRVIFLESGKVAAAGPHSELLKSCPQYAEMYRKQADCYTGGEPLCGN